MHSVVDGHEIVPFDISSVDPACVELVDRVMDNGFSAGKLADVVAQVGPEDTELAELLLQGIAVRITDVPRNVPSVATPIEAARGAALFGLLMRYTSPKEQQRHWRPWEEAFGRIASRPVATAE